MTGLVNARRTAQFAAAIWGDPKRDIFQRAEDARVVLLGLAATALELGAESQFFDRYETLDSAYRMVCAPWALETIDDLISSTDPFWFDVAAEETREFARWITDLRELV